MYLNKAFIVGNLTRDPELKALPSGSKVCSFSLATNRSWKDKEGAKQESVEYHNIVVFGNATEACGTYLKKGQSACVEGRIQTRSWDTTEGEKKYRTEIVADSVQFGPKAGTKPEAEAEPAKPKFNDGRPAAGKVDDGATIEYPVNDINPDDIPF